MRKRVCELVAGIIATDGEILASELAFMVRVFENFGIASGDDDEAVSATTSSTQAAEELSKMPPGLRTEIVHLLVASAVSDGKVVPAEHTYLHAVAKAAEISTDDVDELVAEALLEADSAC